jgi:pilus assembly protein CpaF
VTEVLGFDVAKGEYITQDVFVRKHSGLGPNGEVISELVPSGTMPRALEQVHEHGLELPAAMYEAAALSESGGSAG